MSEADNWYVPARLTPEMNAFLDTTDTPFGKAVRPLQPYRKTLEAKLLWSGHTAIPRDVLEHRGPALHRAGPALRRSRGALPPADHPVDALES